MMCQTLPITLIMSALALCAGARAASEDDPPADDEAARNVSDDAVPGTGAPPPPFSLDGVSSELVKGLRWDLLMVRTVTTYDSIWLSSELTNVTDRRILFERTGDAVLELTTANGVMLQQPVFGQGNAGGDAQRRPARELIDRRPGPADRLHAFRVDLRAYFGPLEPGTYEVRVLLPRGAYSIAGFPGFRAADLRSSALSFQVVATTPEAARERVAPAYRMIKRSGPPAPLTDGDIPTGTITNSRDSPLYVPYLRRRREERGRPDQPLNVPLALVRWAGTGFADMVVPEDTGWARAKLDPGESLTIRLPDWQTEGDGIYLYWTHVYLEDGTGGRGLLGQAYSDPFIIDSRAEQPRGAAPGPPQR